MGWLRITDPLAGEGRVGICRILLLPGRNTSLGKIARNATSGSEFVGDSGASVFEILVMLGSTRMGAHSREPHCHEWLAPLV